MARQKRFGGNGTRNRRLHFEPLEDRRLLAVFTVTNLNDSGPGSLLNAFIAAHGADVADTIEFDSAVVGTINLTNIDGTFGGLTINESLTVNGPGADLLTINGGHGADGIFNTGDGKSVFRFISSTADVVISGLTITGGDLDFGTWGGGGIGGPASNLTLIDVVISGNASSEEGGGVGVSVFQDFSIIRSTISGNVASGPNDFGDGGGNGGGIFSESNYLMITDSTIANNTANYVGGGIWAKSGAASNVTITGSTISGNTAAGAGGVGVLNSPFTLESSTVTNNTATTASFIASPNDDFFAAGGVADLSQITAINNIIAGNFTTGSGQIADQTTDLFRRGSGSTFNFNLIGRSPSLGGTGNQVGTIANPLDPLLAPLANNGGPTLTHALQPGSPAIDQANSVLTTDQRGLPKPADFTTIANHPSATGGAGTDIGAFEAQIVPLSWDRGAGTDAAFDADNWDPDQFPGVFQVVDLDDVFLAPQTIDLAGRTLQLTRIEVDDAPDDYMFTNGTIEIFLTGGNALLTRNSGGALTVDADILFGVGSVDPRFNVEPSAPPIIVTGSVAPSPSRTDAVTLELTSRNLALASSVTIDGVISDGAGGAVLGLTAGFGPDSFNHTGVVTVTGNNTYTGPTIVNGATLVFDSIANADGSSSALGAPTNASDGTIRLGAVDSGQGAVSGTLRYVGADDSSDRAIQLAGAGGVIEAHASATGGLELSGGITQTTATPRSLTLTGDSNFVNTISGDIVNGSNQPIDIFKTGSTTWVLSGSNVIDGDTLVSAGTLLVDVVGTTDLGNLITVESGATFGGSSSTVFSQVLVEGGGRLSPGIGIGTLTMFAANLTNTASQLEIDIAGTTPGSGHDQLVVNSSTDLLGELHVNLDGFVPSNSDEFVIVTSGGNLDGGFSNSAAGRVTTTDGFGSFLVTFDTTNDEVTLSDFQLDPLAGDYDADLDVDGNDFLVWQRGLSPNPVAPLDLDVWETNYGNLSPPLGTSVATQSTSNLIDAALVLWLADETTEGDELLVYDQLNPMTTEIDITDENRPIASAEQHEDEFEIASSKSGKADDSEDGWLAGELLERVFG